MKSIIFGFFTKSHYGRQFSESFPTPSIHNLSTKPSNTTAETASPHKTKAITIGTNWQLLHAVAEIITKFASTISQTIKHNLEKDKGVFPKCAGSFFKNMPCCSQEHAMLLHGTCHVVDKNMPCSEKMFTLFFKKDGEVSLKRTGSF